MPFTHTSENCNHNTVTCPTCKLTLSHDYLLRKCPRCGTVIQADPCGECKKKCR